MTIKKTPGSAPADDEDGIPSREACELGEFYRQRAADPNAKDPKPTPVQKALAIGLMQNFIAGRHGVDELHVVGALLEALLMADVKCEGNRKAAAMLAASGLSGATVNRNDVEHLRTIEQQSLCSYVFEGIAQKEAERQAARDALGHDPDPEKVAALLRTYRGRQKKN